jgi:hypothetical protein
MEKLFVVTWSARLDCDMIIYEMTQKTIYEKLVDAAYG